MKTREKALILAGLPLAFCAYLWLTPAFEWYFHVPAWVPYWEQEGHAGHVTISKSEYGTVSVAPYRGTYRNAVTLELHDGMLFFEGRLLPDEEAMAVLGEIRRRDAQRIVVVLTPPAETLGHILHAVDLLRKAQIGRGVIMYDRKPNQSLEPTSVLGTSAAEQPLVPSTLVAHL